MKIKIIPKLILNLFRRPLTVKFPAESLSIPDGYRGKHKFLPDKCLGCGRCAEICPNKAIEMVEVKQKDGTIKKQPEIDINKCCFCGLCEEVCPTKAIRLTQKIPLANDIKKIKIPSKRSKVEIGPGGARHYDLMMNLISLGRYSHFIKEVVEKMNIRPGQSILDLGSGTGKNDCFMAKKVGPEGKILGLDISKEMLNIAQKRCRLYPQVQFQEQRIDIPLSFQEKFDKVFISFVLHGFENNQKLKIIDNAYRALKSGGAFYILDYNQFNLADLWFPVRWVFIHGECELAREFLKLHLKKMLSSQGFSNFEEELFFKKYLRLLKAIKI